MRLRFRFALLSSPPPFDFMPCSHRISAHSEGIPLQLAEESGEDVTSGHLYGTSRPECNRENTAPSQSSAGLKYELKL